VPLLQWIARDDAYRRGDVTTGFLAERLDETIFERPSKPSPDELAAAAAEALRNGRAPWRIGGVGIPLRLNVNGADVVMEAVATGDPDVWNVTGDYTGAISLRKAACATFSFSAPPDVQTAAHGAHGGNGRITAPMPGKIAKIAVAQGDMVAAHDLLVVLEAMKMEHRIEASGDGSVAAIHVREGDIVSAEAPLIDIQ
jgi:biotin carboxyl carrier protein